MTQVLTPRVENVLVFGRGFLLEESSGAKTLQRVGLSINYALKASEDDLSLDSDMYIYDNIDYKNESLKKMIKIWVNIL